MTTPRHRFTALSTLWILFSYFATSPEARAEELPNIYDTDLTHAVYSEGPSTIPGLTWAGEDGKLTFSIEGMKNGKPAARVAGHFQGKNTGTLIFSSQSMQRARFTDNLGNFSVQIPLTGRKTPVRVQFIDDYGNLKIQDLEIVYEGFFLFQQDASAKKRTYLDVGLSLSHLDFSQTPVESSDPGVKITEIGLTPKIGVTWNLSRKLDFGVSAFATMIPLPMSKEPDGISTPRFYGVNLRIGYKIYSLQTGNIYLMTGPYFWGMLTPPSDNQLSYGVERLTGPQLFLVGRFLTKSGRTAVGYLKGATILEGVGSITENREYAIGGAYQITPPKARRRFMVNLDLASASFVVYDVSGFLQNIKLNSISLGVSTSF